MGEEGKQLVAWVVALLARAWIEIPTQPRYTSSPLVALLARAWIEIHRDRIKREHAVVALLARAWIEIK